MGKTDKQKINISQETELKIPASRNLFAVDVIDWDRIKRLVEKITYRQNWWENSGWFMSSTTIAFFLAYLDSHNLIYLVLSGCSFVITIISFLVGRSYATFNTGTKHEVILEMKSMEEKVNKEV